MSDEIKLDGLAATAQFGDQAAAAQPAAAMDPIVDVTVENFVAEVIEGSQTGQLVLVDFWAPWCGPCKQLTPIIEKVVRGAQGTVKLAKINIDENQQIAQQMRIQSVPTVIAFKNGQPVDGFQGALPESQIKQFIEKHAGPMGPSPAEQLMEQANGFMAQGDMAAAAGAFSAVLEHEPENAAAMAGLAQYFIAEGDLEQAQELLDQIPVGKRNDPAVAAAEAAIKLKAAAADTGPLDELRAAVDADPADFAARFELAQALIGAGQNEEAIEQLLAIIAKKRDWNEGAARAKLLDLFDLLGATDPLTVQGRQKLSSILFA